MESSFSESAEKRDKVSMIFNNVEIIKQITQNHIELLENQKHRIAIIENHEDSYTNITNKIII